ncbi:hypothetical protein CP532_1407 [Ophiocordyceps camponoti-leonardi (nom. inval.)]|nr:hypothetical protein CP532_1407 [Ophiocordyceps camponoti-leonardi (nom. inval.)]
MAASRARSGSAPEYTDAAAAEHACGTRTTGPIRRPMQPLDIPILKHLNSKRVVLASASPRRKALLQQMGLTHIEVVPSNKPEDVNKSAYGPWEYVAETARRKCLDVYTSCLETHLASIPDPDVVIAADTVIVTRDGRILEKPRSEADHIRMLKHLRDTEMHRVLTAVFVLAPREDARHPGYCIAGHTEETKVFFWNEGDGLPDDVIEAYVKTREGVDKAGGYALQGIGGMLLARRVEGSVDNVVGLPVKQCLSLAEKVEEKPRLTELEKKKNHIESEKKRRSNIRDGFDRLAAMVPGHSGQGRSEGNVLVGTVQYITAQVEVRRFLTKAVEESGGEVSEEMKKFLADAIVPPKTEESLEE